MHDVSGRDFSDKQLEGHCSPRYFGYTYCPDLCPTTLRDLAAAKARITKEMADHRIAAPVQIVFVSVDPERETSARLKECVSFLIRSSAA